MDTTSRLVSTSGEPMFSHTRRPSTVDILCRYARAAQLDPRQLMVELLVQVPADADRQVELLDERVVKLRIPLWPSSNNFHVVSASVASAVVMVDAGDDDVG